MSEPLAIGRDRLRHCPDPLREARLLLAHAAGLSRERLHLLDGADLTPEILGRYDAYLTRRAAGEPVSRILGYRDFWTGRFRITPAVLDPRPETETLVALALQAPFGRVLDLGTGSGCILLSLLGERPDALGIGTDLSAAALDVARDNARSLGLEGPARFVRADWFDGVEGRFDLIVSNPPYIAAAELPGLFRDVRDHDPRMALSPGDDGLAAYRAIAIGLADHLVPGGRLLVETGWQQGAAVAAILCRAGLDAVSVHADLEGRDRVVTGRMPDHARTPRQVPH